MLDFPTRQAQQLNAAREVKTVVVPAWTGYVVAFPFATQDKRQSGIPQVSVGDFICADGVFITVSRS